MGEFEDQPLAKVMLEAYTWSTANGYETSKPLATQPCNYTKQQVSPGVAKTWSSWSAWYIMTYPVTKSWSEPWLELQTPEHTT